MSIKMKYYYTYKTSHPGGRYYVGRRTSIKQPHLDKYWGSGKWVVGIKDKSILTKEILCIYETYEELVDAEQILIDKYWGTSNCMNYSQSSITHRVCGENHPLYGVRGVDHPNFGKFRTEEHKERLRVINTGKHHTEETKQKLRDFNLGKKLSPETCQKMSDFRMGIKMSETAKKKLSESSKGKSRLNRETIINIRRLYDCKINTVKELVIIYKKSSSAIYDIVKRLSWKYV